MWSPTIITRIVSTRLFGNRLRSFLCIPVLTRFLLQEFDCKHVLLLLLPSVLMDFSSGRSLVQCEFGRHKVFDSYSIGFLGSYSLARPIVRPDFNLVGCNLLIFVFRFFVIRIWRRMFVSFLSFVLLLSVGSEQFQQIPHDRCRKSRCRLTVFDPHVDFF
jgi:hypothetical protein